MKVRCIRLLLGGRYGGAPVESSDSVTVGREYVVLAMRAQIVDGVSYLVLRDGSATQTVVLAAGMFEITDASLPSSWVARDAYRNGEAILFTPEPWAAIPEFWDRKESGDTVAFDAFRAEVRRLFAEAACDPP